jgi:hypothetical protein
MWEYRIVWPSAKPPWWDSAWKRGETALSHHNEGVETRPDTYFVLSGRVDVGIKLRSDSDLEVKSLHTRSGNWELWEKSPYLHWSSAEAARFANMLRLESSKGGDTAESNPLKGAQEILRGAGLESTRLQVHKKRIQNFAADLLDGVPGFIVDPNWLAEMVEIVIPDRPSPVLSVCVETFDPSRGGLDPFSEEKTLKCGYPELLVRHLTHSL